MNKFSETAEKECVDNVESGRMTTDLASCIHGDDLNDGHYLTTEDFLEVLRVNLEQSLIN